ncbi:hypothetical protein [Stenotrophomonas maltophilia]|uniref:hypothetical protein n=1 Tax=Stenotrophomonas maltophilia TaxID=40324 RepID=UPI00080B76ED|nr:hypothetical protein [Stenotrophomonas maltophilia]
MDRKSYLEIMEFPAKWQEYNLLPAELIDQLMTTYKPGMEGASEHDRNSVFHWWLRQSPSKDVLMKLAELSFLDPDQAMAGDIRRYITQSACFDRDVDLLIRGGP